MRTSSVVALAVISALCACVPADRVPAAPFDPAEVDRALRERMTSYAEAIGALDSARIVGHYVAGAEFRLVSDGSSYSYEDMQRLVGGLKGALRASEVRWDTLVVTPLAADAGLVYAPFHRADTDTAGRASRLRGVASWLWVRREGQWRALYGHGDHYPDTTATP